ncbi:CidA/LrgA family protein [Dyella amyloliquefaciens]|uniref:CidA/LrgA family protein n=1 Tax=Dyella amyloliquefaciens TaxID=1770545 RepID=UPI00197ADC0E|nr:CidA/LrgA family protein [Dyella amyloliquefaciens]
MNSLHVRMRWLAWRRPLVARWAQVLLIVLVWQACDQLSRHLHLPMPGSLLAMALLLAMLLAGAVPAASLRRGADWLLAEMLLFFIPAVMAVWEHLPLMRQQGARILVVILVGTMLVMGTTALLVDLMFRWRLRRAR